MKLMKFVNVINDLTGSFHPNCPKCLIFKASQGVISELTQESQSHYF
jgi:hypothetical protein